MSKRRDPMEPKSEPKEEAACSEPVQERKKGKTIKNIRANPMTIDGLSIASGETIELTEKQQADEHLMRKINHGIKTGVLA